MKFKFSKLAALALLGVFSIAPGCTDYSSDINKLDDKIDQLTKNEIATLQSQVSGLESTVGVLQGSLNTANQNIDSLKKEIDSLKKEDSLLREKFNEYVTKKEFGDSVQKLGDSIAANAGKITKLEERMTKAEAAVERIDSTIGIINGQIDSLKKADSLDSVDLANYKKLTDSTIAAMKAAIEVINDIDIPALKEADKELEKRIDEAFAKFDDYVLVTTFNAYKNEVKGQLEEMQADYKTRIEEMDKAHKELLKNAEDALNKKIEEYNQAQTEALNDAKEFLLNKIETEVADLQSQINNMVKKHNDDSTKFAEADKKLQEQIDALKAEDEKLWEAIDALTERVSSLEDRMETAEENIEDLQARVTALEAWKKKMEDEIIPDIYAKIEALRVDVDDLLSRMQSLVYVPEFNDGKANINGTLLVMTDFEDSYEIPSHQLLDSMCKSFAVIPGDLSVLTYKIRPAELAEEFVAAFGTDATAFSFDVVGVKTRGAYENATLEIKGMKVKDLENGLIDVTVTTKDFSPLFFMVGQHPIYYHNSEIPEDYNACSILDAANFQQNDSVAAYSASLIVTDAKKNCDDRTTEYTNLVGFTRGIAGLVTNMEDFELDQEFSEVITKATGIPVHEKDTVEFIDNTLFVDFLKSEPIFWYEFGNPDDSRDPETRPSNNGQKMYTISQLAELGLYADEIKKYVQENTYPIWYEKPSVKDLYIAEYVESEKDAKDYPGADWLLNIGMNPKKTNMERRYAAETSLFGTKLYYLSKEPIANENLADALAFTGSLWVIPVQVYADLTGTIYWNYTADGYADIANDIIMHQSGNKSVYDRGITEWQAIDTEYKDVLVYADLVDAVLPEDSIMTVQIGEAEPVAVDPESTPFFKNAVIYNGKEQFADTLHNFAYDEIYLFKAIYPIFDKETDVHYADLHYSADITTVDRERKPIVIDLPDYDVTLSKNTFADGKHSTDQQLIGATIADTLAERGVTNGDSWDKILSNAAMSLASNRAMLINTVLGDPTMNLHGVCMNNQVYSYAGPKFTINAPMPAGAEVGVIENLLIEDLKTDTKVDETYSFNDSIHCRFDQLVYVNRNINVKLPKYNLQHSPYFVAYEGLPAIDETPSEYISGNKWTKSGYQFDFVEEFGSRPMSLVQPWFQHNKKGQTPIVSIKEMTEPIGYFDVYNVQLRTAFFPDSAHNAMKWEASEELGLVAKFDFKYTPEDYEQITIDENDELYYGGYDPYVEVEASLKLLVNEGDNTPVYVDLPTRFDEEFAPCENDPADHPQALDYTKYIVCKYEPLILGQKEKYQTVVMTNSDIYSAEFLKNLTLLDRRGYNLIDYNSALTVNKRIPEYTQGHYEEREVTRTVRVWDPEFHIFPVPHHTWWHYETITETVRVYVPGRETGTYITVKAPNENYPWVIGNDNNGFVNEVVSKDAYDINATITIDPNGVVDELIRSRISYGTKEVETVIDGQRVTVEVPDGVVYFDYTNEVKLLQPVVVPVQITIGHRWAVPEDSLLYGEEGTRGNYSDFYTTIVNVVFTTPDLAPLE